MSSVCVYNVTGQGAMSCSCCVECQFGSIKDGQSTMTSNVKSGVKPVQIIIPKNYGIIVALSVSIYNIQYINITLGRKKAQALVIKYPHTPHYMSTHIASFVNT